MRMALCWPSLLLLLANILSIHATTVNYNLTSEFTNFIPSCAQECFKSFLEINFPSTPCSATPTLNCLCSHNSTSGYTIGEGAVQCIISEDNIGFCQGNDAKENVAVAAFNMCNGQANALPNTHGTITATLIVQTSMPSIVLVAPAATTTSTGSPSSSGTLRNTTPSSNTLLTATGVASRSTTASSTAPTRSASEISVSGPVLTKPQIVGITVASVGGGCAVVGAILILLCLRRRKQRRTRESDTLPFQLDPPSHLMNPKKYKYKSFKGPTERKPGGTANGVAARVPPRVPPRIDTSNPNMFSRRSIRTDTIGLAISPESNKAINSHRRSSKLLPEKPTLTLKMPQSPRGAGLSFSQPLGAGSLARQSTATHFEEDEFDSADTAVNADDSWGRKSTEKILDNTVAVGSWPTIRLVDPEPVNATQFADNEGYLWRPPQPLNNPSVSPDYHPKPLNLNRGVGSFSQPRNTDGIYPRNTEQKLQLSIPDPGTRPITASSSVYSVRGSLPGSDNGRQVAPRARISYRQSGPYDVPQSAGSLTSFESDSAFSLADAEPRTAGAELSPVVESPVSGGVSPVTYPKIPKRLSAAVIRMIPPPPQPDFTRAMGAAALGGGPTPGQPPWRQAELAAQKERDRLNRHSQEQARAATRELQIQVGIQSLNQVPGHRRQRSSESHSQSQKMNNYDFSRPAPPTARSHTAPPAHLQPQPLVDATGGFGFNSRINQLSAQPDITFTRSSSQMSQYSQASKGSTSSSLLAKRIGEQKAATLTLGTRSEEERKRWRVLKKEEIEMAKKSGWRPMAGSGTGVASPGLKRGGGGGGAGTGGLDSPITPGWMPRLTPTRRGDELFLSVQ